LELSPVMRKPILLDIKKAAFEPALRGPVKQRRCLFRGPSLDRMAPGGVSAGFQ
jgi:hypothetical protein